MTASQTLLFLGLLATVAAAPWPSNPPRCSTECPVAGSPKLFYSPEKTYVYSYSGRSQIRVQDVEGANVDNRWSAQVELSWLTPCDMAISVKNPSIGGASGSPEVRKLERYPLVVAVIDGRVQQACTHPEDDTWSINMKKGIASAFQNVLPSNSSINTGLNFTETDIIGNCSTRYEVQNEGENVIVKKIKNPRYCQDHYFNRAETPNAWPKAPLPLEDSFSECKQEISKGIYSAIKCQDKTIIRPAFGSYKYIEAFQEATLQFQSPSDEVPPQVSNLRGPLEKNSLRYTHKTLEKDSSEIANLEKSLKQVCEKTKNSVEEEAANELAQALHYLRRVPEEAIPQTLQKIRSGELCGQKEKLESLFLDAIAFVNEAGAIKIMVQELVSGRTTGGRSALYTAAFYLMPRPCIHSVIALQPLFENFQRFPRATVAAATMVNTFCRQNPKQCQEESRVKQLAQTLSTKAGEKCSQTGQEKAREEALVLFKALGNMGVMTSEVASPVIECIKKEDAERSVRAAATQAFRNAKCTPQFQEAKRQLISIALNQRLDTEVRIGSYLAAIRCADAEDLAKITREIDLEQNTQVRGFILSHLLNIQESSAPYKENLKYLLTSTVLPSNFSSDLRKYSRNIDLSYYLPTFGVGAGVESNLIYAPGSFLPRSLSMNFTAALGATPVNFGEIGARIEGLEPLLEELVGPEGYLRRTPTSQVFRDIYSSFSQKLSKVEERLERSFRERRSIDFSTLKHLFDKLYGDRSSQIPKADLFARIGNQEIAFASLAADLKHINVDRLIDSFFDTVDNWIDRASNVKADSLRAAQIYLDYYVPTMQGMPIKMKVEGTAVVGLKMETRSSPGVLKFLPSLSSQLDAFIGFDYHMSQFGIKTKNLVASSSGVSININHSGGQNYDIELVLPEKMELINVKSELYLTKHMKGQPESKIIPPSVRPTRVRSQSCMRTLEQPLGLKICYDIDLPNVFRSSGLPFGPTSTVKLYLQKSDPSMRGYQIKANVQNTSGKKEVKVEVSTAGSSTPRKANVEIAYANEGEAKKVALVLESPASGGIKLEFRNKFTQSEKLLEADAYFSRNRQYTTEAKVLQAGYRIRDDGQEVKLDSIMQTLGVVRNSIHVQSAVGVDFRYMEESRIPVPKRLRKFEFVIGTERSNVVASIAKESESQYSSIFKLGQKGSEVVDFTARTQIEGSSYRDLTVSTDVTGKIVGTQYKSQFAVYYNQEKTGTYFLLARQGDSTKIVEYEMMIVRSGEKYKLKYLFALPAYMKPVRFDIEATSQGSSKYQIEAGAKHGESGIFHADGSATIQLSSKRTQLQTNLRFTPMSSGQYTLRTGVTFIPNKQHVMFDLADEQGRIIATEWNMETAGGQDTNIDFNIKIPSLIEKSIGVTLSRTKLHMNVNDVILPKTSPMKLKGFVDLDFESKKATCKLVWDTVQTRDNELKATASIAGSSTLQHAFIDGEWTFSGRNYQFKTEMALADPRSWFSGRNQAKLEITTPSRRRYQLESVLENQLHSSEPKADLEVSFRTPESREYKLRTEATLQWLGGPSYNMEFSSKSEFTSPQGHNSQIQLEWKHQWTSSQRIAYTKVHITSPSLAQPLNTKLTLNNQQGQYKAEWNVEIGSPADAAMYELRIAPEGGVQSFKAELKLQQVKKVLRSIERLVSPSSSPSSSYISEGSHRWGYEVEEPHGREASYLIHYEKPSSTSHSLKVHSPSRKMEGQYKKSPSEFLVKFYPNKGVSDAKYEIFTRHSTESSWIQHSSNFRGGVSHPSLKKDLKVEAQYTRNEQTVTGSLELDIFPSSADKITGKIESHIISPNTVIIEAQLAGRALKTNPKVTVAVAVGPEVKGFDFKFHKTPSSPASLVVSGKVDMSYGRNAASSFIVRTESQTALDISGSFMARRSPGCYGIRVESRTYSSVIGKYDVSAELCKPFFIKLLTKRPGSDTMYVTRLGIQNLKRVEASIAEADPKTQEERILGMARVMLTSPTMAKFESKYESEKLSNIKNSLQEKWSRLTSAAGSRLDEISREVLKEGGSTPSAQIKNLWQEINAEVSRIYRDLEYDGIIPGSERLQRWANSHIVQGFIGGYSRLWSQYVQLKERLSSMTSNAWRKVQSEFDDVTSIINEVVVETARSLTTGSIPEGLQRLWSQFQETSVYRAGQREIEMLMNRYPEEYQELKQMIQKMKDTLARDFERQSQNIMHFSTPQHIANWVVNRLNAERLVFRGVDKLVKKVIQMTLILPIQIDGNYLQIELPVHRPVYSLPQAASYLSMNPFPAVDTALWSFDALLPTPTDNILWAYYSLVPKHARYLVPPYNSTALVVDSTEILTFDGAVLRVPRSQCKVLLAQHKSDSLIMQNPSSAPLPQFTTKASGVTVVVKPDFTVTINGQPVSGPEQSQGTVTVYKRREVIEVHTPYMTLRVYEKSHTAAVEASGWAYGQLAGLLGAFDGEISTDTITPSGSQPSSLQELVKSWQEDQSCQTPSVSPASPLHTQLARMIQCHAIFGVRSRCNPVLRQEPFMRMCYASWNACDVARAYGAVCARKGVKETFPLGC